MAFRQAPTVLLFLTYPVNTIHKGLLSFRILGYKWLIYNFAAQLNVSVDHLIGTMDYRKLRLILEQFYVEILNNPAISPSKSAEVWSACIKFVVSVSSKVSAQALVTAQRDLQSQALIDDIEGLANIYKQFKAPKKCGSTPIRALSADAISKILEVSEPSSSLNPFQLRIRSRNQILVFLMLFLGLRTSECLVLTASSIVCENDKTWIRVTYSTENDADTRSEIASIKNNYSHRLVPLPNFLYVRINDYLATQRRTNRRNSFIFTSNQGTPLASRQLRYMIEKIGNTLDKNFKSVLSENFRKSGLSPHDLRHTAACNLLSSFYKSSGNDMDSSMSQLREFMGWSPESDMPSRYARLYLHGISSAAAIASIDERVSQFARVQNA